MESMRGAISELKSRRQNLRRGRRHRISRRIQRPGCARFPGQPRGLAGFSPDFFLFYLTPGPIFDNRHGLLKKFKSARSAETLSAVEPQL
jgi:hypothetical protein